MSNTTSGQVAGAAGAAAHSRRTFMLGGVAAGMAGLLGVRGAPRASASEVSASAGPAVGAPPILLDSQFALMGATVLQGDYVSAGSRLGATTLCDTNLGLPLGLACQKVFFSNGGTPTFPTALPEDVLELVKAGVQELWLCYQPDPSGADAGLSGRLATSITALQQQAASVPAATTFKIALWQEPQNANSASVAQSVYGVQQWGAGSFKTMMAAYYQTVHHDLGLDLVYISAGGYGEPKMQTFYPGDANCDVVAVDFYAVSWVKGTRLDTILSVANGANPPKPFAISEMGSVDNPNATPPAPSDVEEYLSYLHTVVHGQITSGHMMAEMMWYNGNAPANPPSAPAGSPTGNPNTIVPGDFRLPYLQQLYSLSLQASS